MLTEELPSLTSDVIFKSFMLDDDVKEYKAELINLITGILKIDIINIEMNNQYYNGLIEKNNSYTFRLLGDRFETGDSCITTKKVYKINIDNYESYHLKLEYLKKKML